MRSGPELMGTPSDLLEYYLIKLGWRLPFLLLHPSSKGPARFSTLTGFSYGCVKVGIERCLLRGPGLSRRWTALSFISRPLWFADKPGPLGNAGPGFLRGLRLLMYPEKPRRRSALLDNTGTLSPRGRVSPFRLQPAPSPFADNPGPSSFSARMPTVD